MANGKVNSILIPTLIKIITSQQNNGKKKNKFSNF